MKIVHSNEAQWADSMGRGPYAGRRKGLGG